MNSFDKIANRIGLSREPLENDRVLWARVKTSYQAKADFYQKCLPLLHLLSKLGITKSTK